LRLKLGDCGRDGHGRAEAIESFQFPPAATGRQMNKQAVRYSWRRRLLEDVEGVWQLAPNGLKSSYQHHPNHGRDWTVFDGGDAGPRRFQGYATARGRASETRRSNSLLRGQTKYGHFSIEATAVATPARTTISPSEFLTRIYAQPLF